MPAIGMVNTCRTLLGKWNTLFESGDVMVVSGGLPSDGITNDADDTGVDRWPSASIATA